MQISLPIFVYGFGSGLGWMSNDVYMMVQHTVSHKFDQNKESAFSCRGGS